MSGDGARSLLQFLFCATEGTEIWNPLMGKCEADVVSQCDNTDNLPQLAILGYFILFAYLIGGIER